ncbi:MAG: hypothetical protein Kow0069_12720 [Promethearchaeota archaeon]
MLRLALIKWDQKLGGVLEATHPRFELPANTCMNVYQLHRMRKTEPSIGHYKSEADQINQVSVFSGFGAGGFGGTGGDSHVGVPERVLSVLLPMGARSRDYEAVAVFLLSRLLVFRPSLREPDGFQNGIRKLGELLERTGLQDKPVELFRRLEATADDALRLSAEQRVEALTFENRLLRYWIADLQADLEEVTLRPASAVMDKSQQYLEELKKKEELIAQLTRQVVEFSARGAEAQAPVNEDEVIQQQAEQIRQMQQDYVEIFSKLTDQLNQQQEEINAISESTRALVEDLNVALREKIQEVQRLREELRQREAEVAALKHEAS